jgi:hypothetical protein
VLGIAAGINDAPQSFYFERVRANNRALTHILYHQGHNFRMKRYTISLTKALYPVIGGKFKKYPIRASVMGRWILDHIGFDIRNFHG